MPVIPIDFSNVVAYDNLPLGKYFGSIDKVEYRPTDDPSKSPQLMATYMVIDGELTGRKSSEFLSFSPKAAFRMKRWFGHFGMDEDLAALDVDDDTNQLVEPDLVGVNIIFEVYEDPKLYQGEKQVRTRLIEVLEDDAPAAAPAPAARPAARPAAAPAPAARPARAAAPAPAPVLEDVEEEEETTDEAEEEEAPAPTPIRRPVRPIAAAVPTPAPARRTLK